MPKKQSGVLGSSPCLNSLAAVFSSVKWGPGKAERVLSRPTAGGAQQAMGPVGSSSSRAPGQPRGHFITRDHKGGNPLRVGGRGVRTPRRPVLKQTAERAEGGSLKKKTMSQ